MQNEEKSASGGKKALPIIIAAAAIILGIGVYGFSRSGKKAASTQTQNGKAETTNESEKGFVGSLTDALKLGVAMKCGWQDDKGNYSESYIKTGRVYSKVVAEGQTGYMIAKDKCVWSWNDAESQGIKICYEEDIFENDEMPETGGISTQGYEFKCVPSTVNDSVFEAPSGVSFVDPMDLVPKELDIDIPEL